MLLELLHTEPTRWGAHATLERRYLLQGYWEDWAEAMPLRTMPLVMSRVGADTAAAASPRAGSLEGGAGGGGGAVPTPLRRVGAAPLPPLQQKVFGMSSVPLAVHFAGCQLCSGKAPPERERACWPAFRRVVRFAEEQTLATWGVRHGRATNRSAADEAALEAL